MKYAPQKATLDLTPDPNAYKPICPVCLKTNLNIVLGQESFSHEKYCDTPGCKGSHYISPFPFCHREAPTRIEYCTKHGILSLYCGECGQLYVAFGIAMTERMRQQ